MEVNIKEFCKELQALMEKHQVEIGVSIDGDTQGMMTDFLVIDSKNKDHIINEGSSYLDRYDIKIFNEGN